MDNIVKDTDFMNYVLDNIHLEQDLYKRSHSLITSGDTMRGYFNSTSTKSIFARYLVEAKLDVNLLYTCSSIAKIIGKSRAAVCRIGLECVEAGWAEQYLHNKTKYIRASQFHTDKYLQYTKTVLEKRNEYVTDYCLAQKLLKKV